jgi:nucleotide-binding universal stress UspA family protein
VVFAFVGIGDITRSIELNQQLSTVATFPFQRTLHKRWSMYQHILIPTDGSVLAERAVTNGLSLAKFAGAKVTVIMVEEPFSSLGFDSESTEQINIQIASVLNRAKNAAKQAGVFCDTIQVEDAQPYQAIITIAADRGCDLIVMASHGRSGVSAVVLGSVTNKVLTHTKIPVLVVQ